MNIRQPKGLRAVTNTYVMSLVYQGCPSVTMINIFHPHYDFEDGLFLSPFKDGRTEAIKRLIHLFNFIQQSTVRRRNWSTKISKTGNVGLCYAILFYLTYDCLFETIIFLFLFEMDFSI